MREYYADNYVFVVRNYRGIKEINYLMTLGDFKKAFATETRTDFFSTHDKDADWKLFSSTLRSEGSAQWAVANNDTFLVYQTGV